MRIEPARACESAGAVFDGPGWRLRRADARAWELYLGLRHLLGAGGAAGFALRIVYGHLVHLFMLMRPALAALDLSAPERYTRKFIMVHQRVNF